MKLTLNANQLGALIAAVSQPGWATTIDALADGVDAVKVLRAAEPDTEFDVPKYPARGIKAAVAKAISVGFFGASSEALELMEKLGMKPTRDEE